MNIKELVEDIAAAQGFPNLVTDLATKRPSEAHELKDKIIKVAGKISGDTSKISGNLLANKAKIFMTKLDAALIASPALNILFKDDVIARNNLSLLLANAYYDVAPKNSIGEKIFAVFKDKSQAELKVNQIFKVLISYGLELDPEVKEPLHSLLLDLLSQKSKPEKQETPTEQPQQVQQQPEQLQAAQQPPPMNLPPPQTEEAKQ